MVSVVEMCVLAGAHRVLALGGEGDVGGGFPPTSWAPVLVDKGAVTSSGTSAKVEAISWPELVWVVLLMCWCATGWAVARLLLKDYKWQTKPRCLPQEHPTWGLEVWRLACCHLPEQYVVFQGGWRRADTLLSCTCTWPVVAWSLVPPQCQQPTNQLPRSHAHHLTTPAP